MSISSTLNAYVYTSKLAGIDEFCANSLCTRLEEVGVQPHQIIRVTDKTYLEKALLSKRAALLIPGGQTTYLGQDLNVLSEKIKQKIRVDAWSYGGFCAGGNLLCRKLTANLRDIGLRDITDWGKLWNLLPVEAQTPVYEDQISYRNNTAPGKLIPIFSTHNGIDFVCYWNAGSKYTPLSSEVTIDASYKDPQGAAVISGKYGNGIVAATGIHPEIKVEKFLERYTPEAINADAHVKDLNDKLPSAVASAPARQECFVHLLKKLEILK